MRNDHPSALPIQNKQPEWLSVTKAASLLRVDSQAILDCNEVDDYPALKQEADGGILVNMIDLSHWYKFISDEYNSFFNIYVGTPEERHAKRPPPEAFRQRSIDSKTDQGASDA